MNIHSTEITREPTREDAARALELLRLWAGQAEAAEIATLDPVLARLRPGTAPELYPALSRSYPAGFVADERYRATLPDLQNGPESLIRGAHRALQHVGISNFRLPLRIAGAAGGHLLDCSVTGSVSLRADRKGINMSRIMRSFYDHAGGLFDIATLGGVIDSYKRDLDSLDARLLLRFAYPMQQRALRSGLTGWQFYETAFEVIEQAGQRTHVLHLDYVYSSTCPCSLELSEHARQTRGQLATPHSQRSVARISAVIEPAGTGLPIEDLVAICRLAVPTETQVMVKREDEQAFAELNAANPIFVEDAARLFAQGLLAEPRIGDFRVIASHQESLHSHDAVSVVTEGVTFGSAALDPHLFATLHHRG